MMSSFEGPASGLINPAQGPKSPHRTERACRHSAAHRDAPLHLTHLINSAAFAPSMELWVAEAPLLPDEGSDASLCCDAYRLHASS